MAIVDMMEKVTAWAQEAICAKVKLKLPNDKAVDASYNEGYTLVHPAAFPLYVPTKDRIAPRVAAPIPSLCVQLLSGQDKADKGTMRLRFMLNAWDPGLHGPDVFHPAGDGQYTQWNGEEAMAYYERRSEGWHDVWHFVDTALRELESTAIVGGFRLVREAGIEYGPLQEDGAIPDYYPYWFAWISFTIEYGLLRDQPSYHEYL